MRLKTKLVLAITCLVFLISGLLSFVYVTQLLHGAVQQSYDNSHMVANQVRFGVQKALQNGLQGHEVDPNKPAELRDLIAQVIRSDAPLHSLLDSINRYSLTVYDVNVADNQSQILTSTNPDNLDKPLPQRPNYGQLLNAQSLRLMREVFGRPRVFDVVVPIERNGQPFITVNVGVRTTLLRAVYAPWLAEAVTLMGFALGIALLAAFLLSNFALRPMERISKQLDFWTAAGSAPPEEKKTPRQELADQVSTKIERIGQRIRSVEEVFSALRENLDQILSNLQDGILLFAGDGRAVLVSEAARRFLNLEAKIILGLHAVQIFDRSTELGRTLAEVFDAGVSTVLDEVRTEDGRRLQVTLSFIRDEQANRRQGQGLGTLVTLHDLESVERIESELELSRRMAAIGRLTAGVGHEVKNPINAIVVHLELLKNKLSEANAPGMRHLEVIDAEIHRLDRVVQTLVDFSRPVELQLREQDLRPVIGDVLALAADELSTRNVTLTARMPAMPLVANVDADLLKQAVLNVVQNGAQAMPEGGRIDIVLEEEFKPGLGSDRTRAAEPRAALLRIADEGSGIPEEIREKIFDLYFTTRVGGSGIGLAMTYRIMQLHHGAVEVKSKPDSGTEFLLRIPLATAEWSRRILPPANSEIQKGLSG